MLADTHCHLTDKRYLDDLDQVIERARRAGVTKMISPGTDYHSSVAAIELAKRYPGVVFATVGIHPEEIGETNLLKQLIEGNQEQVVAVGEIGTDTNTEELVGRMSEQKSMFRAQCEIALDLDLPVVVHTRDSMKETLEVLDSLPQMPRGHFHCWSDSDRMLDEVLSRGFYVGFCGNVTYKNNHKLREQVRRVGSDRLLLETDAPYLPPVGHRGERNEPGNVRIAADMIAETRGVSLEELGKMTTENAERLYEI